MLLVREAWQQRGVDFICDAERDDNAHAATKQVVATAAVPTIVAICRFPDATLATAGGKTLTGRCSPAASQVELFANV